MDSSVLFDHIAIATHRICDAPAILVAKLGGISGHGGPSREFRWWHWDFAGGGRIEVLEPDDTPGGFVARFLERRGPGLHHVTFKVPDLDGMCRRAQALGYEIVGYNDADPGWKEAFLHPKQAMGIVVQFAEVGRRDSTAPRPAMEVPVEPRDPPPAATVIGLRMIAGDRERALRQWHTLLEGTVEDRDRELIFRWPGSPMRIAVTLDPGGEDRSSAIELQTLRQRELDRAPDPTLGTRFVTVDAALSEVG